MFVRVQNQFSSSSQKGVKSNKWNKIKKPCARSNYEDEGEGDVWLWFRGRNRVSGFRVPIVGFLTVFSCDLMERGVAWGPQNVQGKTFSVGSADKTKVNKANLEVSVLPARPFSF